MQLKLIINNAITYILLLTINITNNNTRKVQYLSVIDLIEMQFRFYHLAFF